MLTLVSKISEVQTKGTPDIEFALVGLLARSQTDSGRAEDAVRTVTALRERFEAKGLERFFPNIDALLCRLSLCTGDRLYTDEWYRDKAPKDGVTLKTLKRYQYLTRAMVELSRGDESAALLTLAPLVPYCRVCEKHIDTIHLRVLSAIAKRRTGDCEWRSDICEALGIAAEYGFVRTSANTVRRFFRLSPSADGTRTANFSSVSLNAHAVRRYSTRFSEAAVRHRTYRAAHGVGNAGTAAVVRRQEQCGDRRDTRHKACDGEKPREPHSPKAGREPQKRGKNRRT